MEESYRYFENRKCKYYPCHSGVEHINCLFCYCPLYGMAACPGKYKYVQSGDDKIKACDECVFPHLEENYEIIVKLLSRNGKSGRC